MLQDVDVILYDTFGQVQGDGIDLPSWSTGSDAKVAIFSWNLQPELVKRSIAQGAVGLPLQGAGGARSSWTRSSGCTPASVVVPLEAQAATPSRVTGRDAQFGLTAREAEIIALITQGLSNQEIAERSYLSINSVKTYIRTAYRKMGVASRSQAVLWGVNHGFRPDVARAIAVPRRTGTRRVSPLSHPAASRPRAGRRRPGVPRSPSRRAAPPGGRPAAAGRPPRAVRPRPSA